MCIKRSKVWRKPLVVDVNKPGTENSTSTGGHKLVTAVINTKEVHIKETI